MLAFEFPALREFDDPALEWRRLFSEFFGTFLLVLAGAGTVVVGALSHGEIGRSAAVTAPGLTVLAIILFMGAVSGAHLNPAVAFAFSLRGDFPWRRVPGYVLVQLAGATLACTILGTASRAQNVGALSAVAVGLHHPRGLVVEPGHRGRR